MTALVKFLVTVFFVVVLLWMSIINRESFEFSIYPFFPIDISLPLPFIMMLCVFIGFVWGGLIVWLNGGRTRSEVRKLRREVKNFEKEAIAPTEDKKSFMDVITHEAKKLQGNKP